MLTLSISTGLRRQIVKSMPTSVRRQARRLKLGQTGSQRAARHALGQIALNRATRAGLKQGGPDRPQLVPVNVRGRPALAQCTTRFRASDVFARQAATVADALAAHQVAHFFLITEQHSRRVLVVADSLRTEVLTALSAELAGTGAYLAPVERGVLKRPRLVGQHTSRFTSTIRVFWYLATEQAQFLGGPELGCELQFWREADAQTPPNVSGEPIPVGSLMGERSDDLVPEIIHPVQLKLTDRLVDGQPRPTLAVLDRPHLFSVRQPIDAVYTWVDGSDPRWQARKVAAMTGQSAGPRHALAANDSRYSSHDELLYSLRSVDMYADWIRHIYLVTDDQTPPWLRLDHPRLTVVNHRTLFGHRGRLPTFNSHAIESQLHRIEGLAENYLYLNDDVFFGRPSTPSQYVLANGLAQFFLSKVKVPPGPVLPTDLPVTSAAKNNRDLLVSRFDRTITHKFQHVPHSLRRSVMHDLEAAYVDELNATAESQFRSDRDISVSASLGHYFGYATGRAVPGQLAYLYADIGRADTPDRLQGLLRHRNYDIFCLNDHDSAHLSPAEQARILADFLSAYFPLPSQFER